jgi:tRNA-Thr(GGU) m(6)t(6)A37 methyltransferase TsaA
MQVTMKPIGFVRHDHGAQVPRHWSVSDVKGRLEIDPIYADGLSNIEPGQQIMVIFWFDRSAPFEPGLLRQTPPNRNHPKGVFSICSPRRPNPIGLSVVEVLRIDGPRIDVKHLDMYDGTPILDIKPFVTGKDTCPSTDKR